MEQINFQNKLFPLREVQLSKSNNVFISTVDLNNLLMTETGNYVSKEAELIDEGIYYYVELYQFFFSDKKLLKLIVEESNA